MWLSIGLGGDVRPAVPTGCEKSQRTSVVEVLATGSVVTAAEVRMLLGTTGV
jgi:hypothetical protein